MKKSKNNVNLDQKNYFKLFCSTKLWKWNDFNKLFTVLFMVNN